MKHSVVQSRVTYRRKHRRTGGAMVYVLVLLLVISMIGATLVRGVVAQHRQRLRDEIHAQTVRLAEAGWNRALRNLTQAPSYPGEVWKLESDALGTDRRAEIRIEVTSDAAEPPRKTLQVIAQYPLGSPDVNRVTQTGVLSP